MPGLRLFVVVLLGLAVIACTNTSSSPAPVHTPTPTAAQTTRPTPTDDLTGLTRLVAKQYASRWLAGENGPGTSILDWKAVQAGRAIAAPDVTNFCKSIDIQGLDGAIAKLLFEGLRAVAKPLRRTPPEAVEKVIEVATGFTIKNCTTWLPGVKNLLETAVPATAPPRTWPPSGFTELEASPDFAVHFTGKLEAACTKGFSCWEYDVVSNVSCTYGSFARLQVYDVNDVPLAIDTVYIPQSADHSAVRAHFESPLLGKLGGKVTSVSCF
jgi:hypothetical protein